MPRLGCPAWQYNKQPGYPKALRDALVELLIDLDSRNVDCTVHGPNTRGVHQRLFRSLTEQHYGYYAGNYRGSVDCLVGYEVKPDNDPSTVYEQSLNVGVRMNQMASRIRDVISELDRISALPDWAVPRSRKLTTIVALASDIFCAFLLIHPYADGNGHAARFIVISLLLRYGYRLNNWPIDPRPPEPYVAAIRQYRAGDKAPLQTALIQAIAP